MSMRLGGPAVYEGWSSEAERVPPGSDVGGTRFIARLTEAMNERAASYSRR